VIRGRDGHRVAGAFVVVMLPVLATLAPAWAADARNTGKAGGQGHAGLVVKEFRLVECSVDSPTRVEFGRSMPDSVRRTLRASRDDQPLTCNIDKINRELAPFGYVLRKVKGPTRITPSYDFLKGDSVVLSLLSEIRFDLDRRAGRFLFTATRDRQTGLPYCDDWLVLDGTPVPWQSPAHEFWPPVFASGEVVTLDVGTADDERALLTVRQADSVVYSVLTRDDIASGSVDGFESDGTSWVLEYADTSVVNGVNQNLKLGCDAVFHYRFIHGLPFCFFAKDGKVGMSFAGAVLSQSYDEVVHGRCCEQAAFNPVANDDMMSFYARRNGWWYYVEAGAPR